MSMRFADTKIGGDRTILPLRKGQDRTWPLPRLGRLAGRAARPPLAAAWEPALRYRQKPGTTQRRAVVFIISSSVVPRTKRNAFALLLYYVCPFRLMFRLVVSEVWGHAIAHPGSNLLPCQKILLTA